MSNKLANKIAVVTGGSAGIGFGAAKRFAEEGAQVFITGWRQSELDKAVAEIGGNVSAIQGDASKLAELDRIYAMVKEKAGRIDVLFANAGTYEFATLGKITEEHFDKIFDTNVRGLLFTVQKALPLLSDGASVMLTGSIASSFGIPSMSVYSATKAAVRSFARSWILDLKDRRIRVNVLSPGHTATPGLDKLLDEKQQAGLVPTIPLQRLGTADDLGKAAVFLASDDSAYITGTELIVDGGFSET
jgi:NAD(P)-dependent dehydrogenase (short-subunit alcohol dehydrogenase family)